MTVQSAKYCTAGHTAILAVIDGQGEVLLRPGKPGWDDAVAFGPSAYVAPPPAEHSPEEVAKRNHIGRLKRRATRLERSGDTIGAVLLRQKHGI